MIEELVRRKQACTRLYDHAIESLRTLNGMPGGEMSGNGLQPTTVDSAMMLSDESKRAVVERQKARWAEWKRTDDSN